MRVGLTGGSGFIGQYITESLQEHNEIALLKIIDIEKPSFSGSFKFIHGDIRDERMINAFCQDLDYVIHLAAAHHDFGVTDEEYFDVNEKGTQILLDAMSEHHVNRLIFYSSVAVYGTASLLTDETTIPAPESPYGASKLAAEKKIIDWAEKGKGRKAIIIRPTVVIGARNHANMYFLIDQIYKNRYLFHFGNGTNIKSIAYVKNLVGFTNFLLFNNFGKVKQNEIFNYVDYPQLNFNQTVSIIHGEMGKSEPRIRIPLFLALTISRLFDFAITLTGKNLPISSTRIKKTAAQTQFETTRVAEWMYKPESSTEEGLRDMVNWYLHTKDNDL